MMNQTLTAADAELKQRHRSMWASGDYARVADEIVAGVGPALVAATGIGPGQRVLDVAAGSGNASIPAALAGADVLATDLTPELIEAGRRTPIDGAASISWEVADAEALPYPDADFDTVISCIGVMFAPHHQVAADELVRVCRPGGRIGLLSWTPGGFIGQMFATMKPYAPPPPAGAQPPPLWGEEDHVTALLGDRVRDVRAHTESLRVDAFATPEEFRDYFKEHYGPTIGVYRHIAEDPEQVAALDHDLAELARAAWRPDGTMDWEYLVLTCTRA
jgi:ubiquinone/menaquinone biosynthesis C-methylase UbiE